MITLILAISICILAIVFTILIVVTTLLTVIIIMPALIFAIIIIITTIDRTAYNAALLSLINLTFKTLRPARTRSADIRT